MRRHNDLDRFADVVALLMWQARTPRELAQLTGVSPDTARIWLHRLRHAGVVRVAGVEVSGAIGPCPFVYELQQKPFHLEDTPKVRLERAKQ